MSGQGESLGEWHLNSVEEGKGESCQAEVTASEKALRRECAPCVLGTLS